jgi:DNA-nicking Smr family endonuclease
MSKKRPSEQKSDTFANKPFKALKGIEPASSPRRGPVNKPAAPSIRDEDAADLFLRAVGDVKKLDSPPSAPKKAPAAPRARPYQDEQERRLFLQAMTKMGPDFRSEDRKSEEEGAVKTSSSSRLKQLKRGSIRISAELDLHGFLKDEALFRLERFIASSFARGLQAVLVITGKGMNSPEGPVLQGAVSRWLREQGTGMVAESFPAPRDKGGNGAFVVFLKSRRS